MAQITLLTQGYASRLEGGALRASPSSVLIEDSGIKVLVDPGANETQLLNAFLREELTPEDVDLIFLTHYHPDHLVNIRLFPGKDICDSGMIYRGDQEIPHGKFIPGTDIEVALTPGHSPEHASLLANADEGRWLIAGDLFWWFDDAEQKTDFESLVNLEDEFASDPATLKMSRRRALEVADIVIPGHGKPFALNADW